MSLITASRYAFPKLPHFVRSSLPPIIFCSPYSLHSKLFAHSQTPNANSIHDSVASFNRLLLWRPPPSILQSNKILGSLSKAKHYCTAISLFAEAEFRGFSRALFTLSILLSFYCHVGQMYSVLSILGKIHKMGLQPDIVTLNTLIKGPYIGNEDGAALDFYDDLMDKGFELDEASYGILINGLCKIGKIGPTINLVRKMERLLVKPGVVIYKKIIDGLYKGRYVIQAHELFSKMIDRGVLPDVVSCNSLLHGHCSNGQRQEANCLLPDMVLKDIKLNVYIFNILIDAFCKDGKIIEAQVVLGRTMKGMFGLAVEKVAYFQSDF